jgi:putative GTP pyrophosphokinase
LNEQINAGNEEREYTSESFFSDIAQLREMEYLYNAAIKQLTMRFEILNDEFRIKYARSPIHHIESRLKSTQSIIKKLIRKNYDITIDSAKKNLNDIAGVRVVCCYIDDVYSVADMLLRQTDIRLVHKQDYIETPNYNGYRSLHLDIEIPIYLSEHTEYVAVEIQLRSVAMDFWASLEHDLRYKSDKDIPDSICKEMLESSDEINALDVKMQEIYKKIQAL